MNSSGCPAFCFGHGYCAGAKERGDEKSFAAAALGMKQIRCW